MILKHGNNLLTDLTHYYKFNGESIDSISANNGTDTAMTYPTGKLNDCASFNGTTSKSVLTTPITIAAFAEFSISFWIYGINTGHGLGGILSPVVGNNGILHFYSDAYCSVGLAGGSDTIFNSIPVNQWSHIVLTGDGAGIVKMYCNTVLSPDRGKNDIVGYSFENFGYTGQYLAYLDTKIDEFGIWNRTLTHEDISDLYNRGNGLSLEFFRTGSRILIQQANKILNNRPPLIKGIKAAFNFDNNLLDSTGNGYDIPAFAPPYDVVYATGVVNQCVDWNGTYAYGPLALPLDMSNKGTISFWMNPDSTANVSNILSVIASNSAASAIVYSNNIAFNYKRLTLNSGGNSIVIENIPMDAWTHIVYSYDETGVRTYVNGNYYGSDPNPIGILVFYYIAYSGSSGVRFKGKIDAVNFWDRVLYSEDVHQLFTTQKQYPF